MRSTEGAKPGTAFIAYVVTIAPLLGLIALLRAKVLHHIGGGVGTSATLFVVLTLVAIFLGTGLQVRSLRAPVRSLGLGILLGGFTGALIIVVFLASLSYAIGHTKLP